MDQRQIETYPQYFSHRYLIQAPGRPALVILARDAILAAALWTARHGQTSESPAPVMEYAQ